MASNGKAVTGTAVMARSANEEKKKKLAFIYQKDTAKEQGHGRMTYKVFSLNPFYYFGEDNWNIVFKQILRNEHACNLLPKKC